MACVQLGMYPETPKSRCIQLCPVDFAAKAIVLLSKSFLQPKPTTFKIFHVISPHGFIPFHELFENLVSPALEHKLVCVPFSEWNQRIQKKETSLLPFRDQLKKELPASIPASSFQFQEAMKEFDLECPQFTPELFKKYIAWNQKK